MLFRFFTLSILMKILLNLSSINGYPSSTNSDQCLNYCLNDGICVLSESSPQCYCLPEWKGEHCNVIRKSNSNKKLISKEYLRTNINLRNHPCSLAPPNMCKNGGQCQYENKEYSCICPYTHIGKRCEEESPCNNYCKNGGLCTMNDEEDPECDCEGTGYTGLRCHKAGPSTAAPSTTPDPKCEALEDMCSPGTCYVKTDNTLGCQCPSTHTGEFCETSLSGSIAPTSKPVSIPASVPIPTGSGPIVGPTVTYSPSVGIKCSDNPCRNGRPCYNNGNSYFCDCGTAFTGNNCEFSTG